MKRRIKAGEFAFPDNEWSRVSKEAKDLITGMLETIPEKRSTINDVMKSNWISKYYSVPQTPLPSLEILKEDKDNWVEVQQNMGKALDEMRINWDSKYKLKKLEIVNNPLFERRMNKKAKTGAETKSQTKVSFPDQQLTIAGASSMSNITPTNSSSQLNNMDMVVEDYSREASMVSVRSLTPMNSTTENK
jgi:serine/threonine protein kinase